MLSARSIRYAVRRMTKTSPRPATGREGLQKPFIGISWLMVARKAEEDRLVLCANLLGGNSGVLDTYGVRGLQPWSQTRGATSTILRIRGAGPCAQSWAISSPGDGMGGLVSTLADNKVANGQQIRPPHPVPLPNGTRPNPQSTSELGVDWPWR